jgi:glycosyltransferase involved in cell wall biosynthesis
LKFNPKAIPRVCLQNASYLPIIDKDARGVALLQDNLFDPRLVRMQTKVLNNAKSVVTNSIPMINLDAKNHFIWQPLPISDLFIHAAPTAERMPNTCIFVGAFNETKGWSEVRNIIIKNPTISFDLVSKYEHDSPGNLSDFPNNVKIHRRLSQEELVKLYDSASFFILGSPLETQCLAAIEAAARGVVVVMKETGMLAESSHANKIGFFGDDLAKVFAEALDSSRANFHSRETLLKMRLTNLVLEEEWEDLLLRELQKSFYPNLHESLTLRERVVRKINAPRMVSEHA